MRTRPGLVEPEVYFRIVYVVQNCQNGVHVATYRDQTVEIALGLKGAFENENIGTLKRRVATDQTVMAVPINRGNSKLPRELKTPRVADPLRKPIEWHSLLESSEISGQAEIARREGFTRARINQ